jgi:hypothetical protein
MRMPQMPIPGLPSLAMGLPWFVHDLPGLRLAMHGGDTFGQHTAFVFGAGRGFAFILLTNAEPAGGLVELAVFNEAAQRYLGLGLDSARAGFVASLTAPAGTPTVTVPAEDLAGYAGRYSAPGISYVLRAENNGLLLTAEQTFAPEQIMSSIAPSVVRDAPVHFIAHDLARIDTAMLPFVRKTNGSIGWIDLGLRLVPGIGPA